MDLDVIKIIYVLIELNIMNKIKKNHYVLVAIKIKIYLNIN